jgi:hypothetical protein
VAASPRAAWPPSTAVAWIARILVLAAGLDTIFFMMWHEPRRLAPRVRLDGLCGVVCKDDLRHAAMVDLSAGGVRLERPFDPARASRVVQLEIELPDIDEVVWARGDVSFAFLTPMGGRHPNGEPRFWCRAGIRIAGLARRDRRLLRDYVIETRRGMSPAVG